MTRRAGTRRVSCPRVRSVAGLAVLGHITLIAAQHSLAYDDRPLQSVALYVIALTVITITYVASMWHAKHAAATARRYLIVLPLAIQLMWLVPLPTLSIDAYSYVVDAATIDAGGNPYARPVRDAAQTPLGRELRRYRWRPVHGTSPYGPAWMNALRVVAPLSGTPVAAVRAIKTLAMIAVVVSGLILCALAPPGGRLVVLTAFWWNPAVIVEAAGEGHNDALMIVGVLAAVWALQRRWPVIAAVSLTVAILTKYVPVLFCLPCAAYAWRARLINRRVVLVAAAVSGAVAVILFLPFWIGARTFDAVRRVGYPDVIASSTGALLYVLPQSLIVIRLLRVSAVLATGLLVVRGAIKSMRQPGALLHVCADLALLYVVVSSPLFWAWYMLLPIALIAATGNLPLLCVVTVASRLVAPLDQLRVYGILNNPAQVWLTTIIALWVPLAFLVWQRARSAAPDNPGPANATAAISI